MSQKRAISHIAKAECWGIVNTIRHDNERSTETYAHGERGVIMIGWTGDRLSRLSWINKTSESPIIIAAADSRFEIAVDVLTGARKR
ncbi:membrane protein [Mycobacterium phage Nanosmite]|nr:membrane protein [Mycobacterium phage Nanosmite]